MDDLDRAKQLQDMEVERAIKARKEEGPQERGECLNCGEILDKGRWCDRDCRDEWEFEQKRIA